MPIAIAPTAMQRMAHPDGELATARGKFNDSIDPFFRVIITNILLFLHNFENSGWQM